jgi:hypothetical protein
LVANIRCAFGAVGCKNLHKSLIILYPSKDPALKGKAGSKYWDGIYSEGAEFAEDCARKAGKSRQCAGNGWK